MDEVWRTEFDPATRTVDQHIKRLRERLGPAGEYVETVRREGYRFARQVSAQELRRVPAAATTERPRGARR